MKKLNLVIVALALACVPPAQSVVASPKEMKADLMNKSGVTMGTVTLIQLKQGVKIEVNAFGLKTGKHAFHIHQKDSCVGPDFKSAGEHFFANQRKHGHDANGGPHQGDLPNLVADDSGAVRTEMINREFTLTKGSRSLFKSGGVSFVIHEGQDDNHSQPAGNSGDRIACAELHSKGSL